MRGGGPPSLWDNPDATERLKVHHAAGLSCSQIARALNTEFRGEPFVSRNAVIGRLARLGLTHRADPTPPKRLPAPTPLRTTPASQRFRGSSLPPTPKPSKAERARLVSEAASAGQPSPAFSPPRPADPTIALVPRHWETRRFSECAFPVGGEGADTLSCCNPTRGETYCTDHRRAMYSGGSSARELIHAARRYA